MKKSNLGIVLLVVAVLASTLIIGGCAPSPATSAPATSTPVPSTDTPVPPTDTPVPATDTPLPATDTPEPAQPTEAAEPQPDTELDGLTVMQERCTTCHGLENVVIAKRDAEQWRSTVQTMIQYGMEITDEEQEVLVQFLAEKYGPEEVAALDGAQLLQERCTECHSLGRVESTGKTEAEWQATVERMIGHGARLNAEEQTALVQYLAETYPQ